MPRPLARSVAPSAPFTVGAYSCTTGMTWPCSHLKAKASSSMITAISKMMMKTSMMRTTLAALARPSMGEGASASNMVGLHLGLLFVVGGFGGTATALVLPFARVARPQDDGSRLREAHQEPSGFHRWLDSEVICHLGRLAHGMCRLFQFVQHRHQFFADGARGADQFQHSIGQRQQRHERYYRQRHQCDVTHH